MTLSRVGRATMALVVSVAMGLGMTSCGGGTVGYMWVLGTQFNQIAGFKIDDYSGNLTPAVGSPYPSGGSNPIMLTLKSGGRYLYVLNAGSPNNIAEFSVGYDGTLTFQESYASQGTNPVWITTDTTGNYLYELDAKSPDYATTKNGSITAYSLDPNTGRLSLITNAQVKNSQGTQLTYFDVGPNPVQMRYASSGCLYTLDGGTLTNPNPDGSVPPAPIYSNQNVFPYQVTTSNGQLTQPTNSVIALPTSNATSVNIGQSYVYVTDAGSTLGGPGSILPYTQGANCALAPVTTGTVQNLPTASNPIQTLTDSKGKFLYVLNHSTSNTNYTNSSISVFTILPSGELQQPTDPLNPYSTGPGPVCLAEDPTNQYLYTSNNFDGTVTGKMVNQNNTGQLTPLTRGSTFPAVGLATCMVISGAIGY